MKKTSRRISYDVIWKINNLSKLLSLSFDGTVRYLLEFYERNAQNGSNSQKTPFLTEIDRKKGG